MRTGDSAVIGHTIAMARGDGHAIHQCAYCGALLAWHTDHPAPTGPCPSCQSDHGWLRQHTDQVGPFRLFLHPEERPVDQAEREYREGQADDQLERERLGLVVRPGAAALAVALWQIEGVHDDKIQVGIPGLGAIRLPFDEARRLAAALMAEVEIAERTAGGEFDTRFDELLADLFTTALEGGIGYWSSCSKYRWRRPDADPNGAVDETQDLAGFYADIIETGDGDDDTPHHIDREVMLRGYMRAVAADGISWTGGMPPRPEDDAAIEDWDFDATDADCIVQLGLFDEVRYG